MSIDINKSFKLIFSDPQWPQKILIGGVFFFLINILQSLDWILESMINLSIGGADSGFFLALKYMFKLIFVISGIILTTFPYGYVIQSAHNEIMDETPILPGWDQKFRDYFRYGLYFIFISIIYFFIIMLISSIPTILGYILSSILNNSVLLTISKALSATLIAFPALLFFTFISPFIFLSYAENFEFKDAFRLDKIISSIIKVFPEYFICIGLSLLIFILSIALSFALVCTCIGIVFLPFISLPMLIILFNLFSQAYKKSQLSV